MKYVLIHKCLSNFIRIVKVIKQNDPAIQDDCKCVSQVSLKPWMFFNVLLYKIFLEAMKAMRLSPVYRICYALLVIISVLGLRVSLKTYLFKTDWNASLSACKSSQNPINYSILFRTNYMSLRFNGFNQSILNSVRNKLELTKQC